MNTKVRCRPRTNPPVIEYYEDGNTHNQPDLLLTRIWMGIVPPDEEPGYVCVVGEVYDGDLEQRARQKVLLDEGSALEVADMMNEEDRQRWHRLLYCDIETEDGERKEIPRSERPTLDDLRQAATALKDLYSYSTKEVMMCWSPGGDQHVQFHQYMQSTWGFTYPGKRDPEQWAEWYPYFRNVDYRMAVSNQPPFGDNAEYAHELVESLLAGGELLFNESCHLFLSPELENPRRAVGMVLAAMQLMDWSWKLEDYREIDGYDDWREGEAEQAEEQLASDIEKRLRIAGAMLQPRRGPTGDRETNPYLKTNQQEG